MPIKLKQVYICDGCGVEFEETDNIRIFTGEVLNGDKSKSFIRPNEMYCLNCLQFALDYENKNPETVIIKEVNTNLEEVEPQNLESRIKNLEIFQQETVENLTLVAKNIEKTVKLEKSFHNQLLDLEEKQNEISHQLKMFSLSERMENDILSKEAKKSFQIIEKQNDFINEGGLENFDNDTCEPEIPNDINDSVTKEEPLSILEIVNMYDLKDQGNLLFLYQIQTLSDEELFVKEICNLKDVTTLKEQMGLQSLIGLYFSIEKYVDDTIDISNSETENN